MYMSLWWTPPPPHTQLNPPPFMLTKRTCFFVFVCLVFFGGGGLSRKTEIRDKHQKSKVVDRLRLKNTLVAIEPRGDQSNKKPGKPHHPQQNSIFFVIKTTTVNFLWSITSLEYTIHFSFHPKYFYFSAVRENKFGERTNKSNSP